MRKALQGLCERDKLLDRLHQQFGPPPLLRRPQTFATLVHIILEQKVSLSSAEAVMSRVRSICPEMKPSQFLKISDKALREAGMSNSKLAYCRSIALSIESDAVSLPALRQLSDDTVIATLTTIRGIGPWSAGVYLMMALCRPDAWASGDRALAVSYAESANLETVPSYAELDDIARAWIPDRATAARMLWHAYLQKRNRC